jgi:hypothetical protein
MLPFPRFPSVFIWVHLWLISGPQLEQQVLAFDRIPDVDQDLLDHAIQRSGDGGLPVSVLPVSVLTIDTPCGDSPACPLRLRLDQLLRAEVARRLGSRRNEVVPSTGTCSIQFFFRTR